MNTLSCLGAGHSLGGFTAVSCVVLCERLHSAVAFEAPGLTTFYLRASACRGGPAFWRERVTTYLAIPNPINMCQSHLGRIVRCAPHGAPCSWTRGPPLGFVLCLHLSCRTPLLSFNASMCPEATLGPIMQCASQSQMHAGSGSQHGSERVRPAALKRRRAHELVPGICTLRFCQAARSEPCSPSQEIPRVVDTYY